MNERSNIILFLLVVSAIFLEAENGENDDYFFEGDYNYTDDEGEYEHHTLSPDLQFGSTNKTHLIPSHIEGVSNGHALNHSNGSINSTKLCGLPIFLDEYQCSRLEDTVPLEQCARAGFFIFTMFNVILGVTIIFGNSLLPIGMFLNEKLRKRGNYVKVSLSVADILIGFMVLSRIVPNSVAILQESRVDILRRILTERNSLKTAFVGSLFMLNLQASSLHLMLMSMERALAVYKPFLYRKVQPEKMTVACLIVWIVSVFFAFFPAILQHLYAYEYQAVWLLSVLVFERSPDNSIGNQGTVYVLLTIILPYLSTVSLTIAAAIKIRKQLKSKVGDGNVFSEKSLQEESKQISNQSQTAEGIMNKKSSVRKRRAKMENRALETSAIMIASHSITTLPLGIVYACYVSGALTCSTYAIPWTLAFYLRIFNSFANFLIYTQREEEFRSTWQKVFKGKYNESGSTHFPRCCSNAR